MLPQRPRTSYRSGSHCASHWESVPHTPQHLKASSPSSTHLLAKLGMSTKRQTLIQHVGGQGDLRVFRFVLPGPLRAFIPAALPEHIIHSLFRNRLLCSWIKRRLWTRSNHRAVGWLNPSFFHVHCAPCYGCPLRSREHHRSASRVEPPASCR